MNILWLLLLQPPQPSAFFHMHLPVVSRSSLWIDTMHRPMCGSYKITDTHKWFAGICTRGDWMVKLFIIIIIIIIVPPSQSWKNLRIQGISLRN
jgi:hypothetical protein